ncbi:hypothetical protein LguiB_013747 [Lonicera macranthoides]
MPSLSLSQTHSLPLPATKHRRRYRRCRTSTFNSLNLLSKLDQLAVDRCWNLKSLPELPPNIKVVIMDDCISMERIPDLSNSKKSILFNPQRCSFVASHNMLKFNSVKSLRISPQSNLIRNFIDILSQIISRLELKLLAVYEAKKDGLVATRICGDHPHKQSKGKICFACFESHNCGNFSGEPNTTWLS